LFTKATVFLRGRPLAVGIITFFLGAGALGVLDLLDRIPNLCLRLIEAVTILSPADADIELTVGGRVAAIGIYVVLVLVVAATASVISHYIQIGRHSALDMRRLLPETAPIYRALVAKGPRIDCVEIDRTLTIRKDYSVTGQDILTMGATGGPLSGLAAEISSNVASAGIGSTKFRAVLVGAERGYSLVTLPAEDTDNRKRFVTIIFPALMPGEDPLKHRHSWVWQGSAKGLRSPGGIDRNTLNVNRRAAGPVQRVKFTLDVELDGGFQFDPEYDEDDAKLEAFDTTTKRAVLVLKEVKPGTVIRIGVRRQEAGVKTEIA